MPITDEALLQMMFKQHEGQPIEFIMAEYGKAKRLYLEIEQGLAQGASGHTIEVVSTQVDKELPAGDEKVLPKKRYTKRSLKYKPEEAITEDHITCCLCGKEYSVLTRHLMTHEISPEEYRRICEYPQDQTLMSAKAARTYKEQGKSMAKARAEKLATKAAQETASAAE